MNARSSPPAFEQHLGDAGQQRDVAADVRLHVQAGDLRAEQQAPRIADGTRKLTRPSSFDRVDDDDVPAAAADRHQRCASAADGSTPGCRRSGRYRSACSTSSSCTVAVPVPSARRQADAARLVAVVRAVVDVVGAEEPGEELQQEAGFVRRAAAGVEEAVRRAASLAAARRARSSASSQEIDAIVRVARAGVERRRRAGRTIPARAARASAAARCE